MKATFFFLHKLFKRVKSSLVNCRRSVNTTTLRSFCFSIYCSSSPLYNVVTLTQKLSYCSLSLEHSALVLISSQLTSLSAIKNCPDNSSLNGYTSSYRISSLQPASTIFFAISTPSGPKPAITILLSAYLATASIPIAPIYLLHLSFTFSSLMFIDCCIWFSEVGSQLTSISSIFAIVPPVLCFFSNSSSSYLLNFLSSF